MCDDDEPEDAAEDARRWLGHWAQSTVIMMCLCQWGAQKLPNTMFFKAASKLAAETADFMARTAERAIMRTEKKDFKAGLSLKGQALTLGKTHG